MAELAHRLSQVERVAGEHVAECKVRNDSQSEINTAHSRHLEIIDKRLSAMDQTLGKHVGIVAAVGIIVSTVGAAVITKLMGG